MTRSHRWWVWTCCLAAAGSAAGQQAETLEGRLDAAARSLPMGRARLGMHVVDLAGGQVLYSRRAEEACIPASNVKLVTAAAALEVLGADFQYVTRVGWIGQNVAVIASGDPAIGDARILAADPTLDDSIYGVFDGWAKLLAASRQAALVGDLVVDDTIFDRQFVHPSWDGQPHSAWYAAQVGGANFNDNCLDVYALPAERAGEPATVRIVPQTAYVELVNNLTTGRRGDGGGDVLVHRVGGTNKVRVSGTCTRPTTRPIHCTIHNPPGFFAMVLSERLAKAGLPVLGQVKLARVRMAAGEPPEAFQEVARHATALPVVLQRVCKHSQNLFAEAVLKTMGAYHGPPEGAAGGQGSWDAGRAAVAGDLAKVGLAEGRYVYDDGCGLSKANRFSPRQITAVLAAAWKAPYRQPFLDSLAIAGADGTLADRMTDGPAAGRVFAKTGYVRGASALSGYVLSRSNRWLAFSFLFNGVASNRDAKKIMDRLCAELAEL